MSKHAEAFAVNDIVEIVVKGLSKPLGSLWIIEDAPEDIKTVPATLVSLRKNGKKGARIWHIYAYRYFRKIGVWDENAVRFTP